MKIPARPHRAPAIGLSWPIVQKMAAGEIDEAMEMALKKGERVKKAQKSALGQIKAAGGTGRRTR
jgi:hypothetical protein